MAALSDRVSFAVPKEHKHYLDLFNKFYTLSELNDITIAYLPDPGKALSFDEEDNIYQPGKDFDLEFYHVQPDNQIRVTGPNCITTHTLVILNGLDRIPPQALTETLFFSNPNLQQIYGNLVVPPFLSKHADHGFEDTDSHTIQITDNYPIALLQYKIIPERDAYVNIEHYRQYQALDSEGPLHTQCISHRGWVDSYMFYRPEILGNTRHFSNPLQLPIDPESRNKLLNLKSQLAPWFLPDSLLPRSLVACLAARTGLSDVNVRFLLNLEFTDIQLELQPQEWIQSFNARLPFRFELTEDPLIPIDVVPVALTSDTFFTLDTTRSGGADAPEVPRRERIRRAILNAARPYHDFDDEEVESLVKTRKWSPELCYQIKRSLCSQNVSCFNIHFGQEYGAIETQHQRNVYKTQPDRHIKTSLAPEHPVYVDLLLLAPDKPHESKEYLHPKYGWTEQFKHGRPFQGIFPTHQQKDYATRKWSLEYRVKYATHETNVKRANEGRRKALGSALFLNFVNYLGLAEHQFNELEFLDCVTENTLNRLRKPLYNLFNIRDRGDLGVNHFDMVLFLKSQICKKLEKMYKEARPGQIISNLHAVIIILMGPVVRYIHRIIENQIRDKGIKLYFHGGRDINELDAFVRDFVNAAVVSTTNDFTMFDQSQDVEFLNFQILLMKHLHIPDFFVDYYFYYKTSLQSQYGPVAVMIFSGEPPTWHFNSYDNLAWSATVYHLDPSMPAAISGDDSLFNGTLIEKPDPKNLKKIMTLQAKPEVTFNPVFCGWICRGGLGVLKHPQLIYIRTRIAYERGNVADVIQSYAEEAQFAYRLGDHLYDILDPLNLGIQQLLNRFFTLNADKLGKKNFYKVPFERRLIR